MRGWRDVRWSRYVPRIVAKVKDGDIEGDWVTIGVIVDKLPPKDSVKVSMYMDV